MCGGFTLGHELFLEIFTDGKKHVFVAHEARDIDRRQAFLAEYLL